MSHCQKGWGPPIDKMSVTGAVYAIPCGDCHRLYVGQTGRSLSERICEHERAVRLNKEHSALVRHKNNTGHQPDLTKVSIIYIEKNNIKRLNLEAVTIAANKNRLLNITQPNLHMVTWWEVFRDAFPDCV